MSNFNSINPICYEKPCDFEYFLPAIQIFTKQIHYTRDAASIDAVIDEYALLEQLYYFFTTQLNCVSHVLLTKQANQDTIILTKHVLYKVFDCTILLRIEYGFFKQL